MGLGSLSNVLQTASPESAFRFLQVIALALPAIALYMNVLTEVHMVVSRQTGLMADPESDQLQHGRGEVEWETDRYTARLTEAVHKLDFAFSLASLVLLLLSGVMLTGYLLIPYNPIYYLGVSGVGVGFILMTFSVLTTLKISVSSLREPE